MSKMNKVMQKRPLSPFTLIRLVTGDLVLGHQRTKSRYPNFLIPLMAIFAVLTIMGAGKIWANPDKEILVSSLVYRADGEGDFSFKRNGVFEGTMILPDGAVGFVKSPGAYELKTPFVTKGTITGINVTWSFSGAVTMEVSATGKSEDYVEAINGLPLGKGEFNPGSNLKWRASLSAGSKLEEVKISYSDSSGVAGSWGTPELSGFLNRKPIYIKGSEQGALFNYQMQIKVGESSKSGGADVILSNPVQSDFADLRFTLTDGRTLASYWLEEVTGAKPNRTATFWVKIPQLPKQGLFLYLYYSKPGAEDLSDGNKVFSFFDDFKGTLLDADKWAPSLDNPLGKIELTDGWLNLSAAKVTSKTYRFSNGIIEYKAKAASLGAVSAVIRGNSSLEEEGKNRSVFSSASDGAQHCIAIGNKVVENSAQKISANTIYNYRITTLGTNIDFKRFDSGWEKQEAEVKYNDAGGPSSGYLGLAAGSGSSGISFEWVRMRQLVTYPPQVDTAADKNLPEEATNLAEFQDIVLANNGDLILAEKKQEGSYISALISPDFKARVIIPQWRAVVPDNTSLKVDISAAGNLTYKEDCQSGAYYYASKKDFTEGDTLRWRIKLSRQSVLSAGPALQEFSFDYRPGRIEIIWPNDGEALRAGSQVRIAWDAEDYGPDYPLNLYYSTDGGRRFKPIAEKAGNSGRYIWVVPDELTDKGLIKVSDAFDRSVYDVSDGRFSIVEGEALESEAEKELAEKAAAEKAAAEKRDRVKERAKRKPPDTAGRKLYEILVKSSSGALKPGEEAVYDEGDIIMIKPAGFLWGASERQNFTIVQVYLTEAEAEEFMSPQEEGPQEGAGSRGKRYRIDLRRDDLLAEEPAQMKGRKRSGHPLVTKTAIIKKKK